MNKILKVILSILTVVIVLWSIIFIIDYSRCANFKMPIFVVAGETADDGGSGTYHGLGYTVEIKKYVSAEYGEQLEKVEMYILGKFVTGAISEIKQEETNIAVIKNGNINNENIIEQFITKVSNNEECVLKIKEYKTEEQYDEIELKYLPRINETKIDENNSIVNIPGPDAILDESHGYYYTLITNNDENTLKMFSAYNWVIKRKVENDVVKLCLDTVGFIDVTELPVICSYSLESSNYTNNINLHYYQRKDLGIKTIVDKNTNSNYDFNVFTFGGDVSFTIDTDMVYTFEEALKQNVVTIDGILEQAKLDAKYGVCEERLFKDGGSIEYGYADYTILKYNTLDGNKDLVIGFKGQIINQVNKLYE